MAKFVVIEQSDEGEAYVTHVRAKDIEKAYDNYESVEMGSVVILTEDAFGRLCQMGAGAK